MIHLLNIKSKKEKPINCLLISKKIDFIEKTKSLKTFILILDKYINTIIEVGNNNGEVG